MNWDKVNEARKAIAALLLPALFVIGGALMVSSDGGTAVTTHEWVLALIAALGTSGAVYSVTNGASQDPTTSTPEV